MRFGNDMITFEEAVAYLKDMPRFTVKKNPADSRDLKWFLKKTRKSGEGSADHSCGGHQWKRLRLCLHEFDPAGSRLSHGCIHFTSSGGYAGAFCREW